METHKYAVAIYNHTSSDNGDINENKLGGSFIGFAKRILIPSVINGIVKSTAVLRSYVIVRSQIAKSAFYLDKF